MILQRKCRLLAFGVVFLGLVGCTSYHNAPVVNGWRESYDKQGAYVVEPGDTLYSVAWRFGYDYQELVRVNHLSPPYTLRAGQKLYLVPPKQTSSEAITYPQQKASLSITPFITYKKAPTPTTPQKAPATPQQTQKPISATVPSTKNQGISWTCPTQGHLDNGFSSNNKGLDITNIEGTPIVASASGEVVYSGNGLLGYGNLLILKHNDNYLSAYAHNQKNLVEEGQKVNKGEKIALMGHTGTTKTSLHYEVRYNGKPVDPQKLLPAHCFSKD